MAEAMCLVLLLWVLIIQQEKLRNRTQREEGTGSFHVAPTARTANLGTGWHLLLILLPMEVW